MTERSFAKKNRKPAASMAAIAVFGAVLLLAISSVAVAGGFQLSVETPDRSASAQLKGVVLVARTFGCHQPADAKLTASAEGVINGQRKSLPLELISIGSGVYGIKQQWPSEGSWVISLTGAYNGMTSSVLVDLGSNGKVFPDTRLDEGNMKGVHARGARRVWASAEIDSALKAQTGVSEGQDEGSAAALSRFGKLSLLVGGLGASVVTIGLVSRSRRRRSESEMLS